MGWVIGILLFYVIMGIAESRYRDGSDKPMDLDPPPAPGRLMQGILLVILAGPPLYLLVMLLK